MPESASGGSKKPPKSARAAAKPSKPTAAKAAAKKPAATPARAAAKKPATPAAKPAKTAAKKPAKPAAKPAKTAAKPRAAAAKPAARKPVKAKAAAGSKVGAQTRKPTKVVSATPSSSASGSAAAKKTGTGTSAKAADAPKQSRKPRSAGPKVTPAVAPPKPVTITADKPAPAPAEAAPAPAQKPAASAAAPAPPPAQKPAALTAEKPAAPAPSPAESSAPTTSGEREVVQAAARGYFEALAARDADAAVGFWSPDGVDDVLPLRILRGPEAIRAFLDELFTAVPDLLFTVERITADEKVAAVQWRLTGTFTSGMFEGLEPTGRRVELRGIDCLEVVDGKIVHNTGVFDGAAFARQVGLLPPEDSGADRAIRAGLNTVTKLRRTVAKRTAR